MINNIKLQAINSGKAKAGKKNINSNFSKNFEKKIKEIKNENLKNSLNDLYKVNYLQILFLKIILKSQKKY